MATTFDLLIRGGRVIDPAQKLDGSLDVAVKDGRIAAVAAGISRLCRRPGPGCDRASWSSPG